MSGTSSCQRGARGAAWPTLLLALLAGCGASEPSPHGDKKLETVDVAGPIDAGATTDLDVVATPRPVAASGVLPGDFPREVPLPVGATLVDFGEGAAGSWIELVVASPPSEVESGYRVRLARAGFREATSGVWSRGSSRLTVTITPRGAGSTVRLEPLSR